MSTVRFSKFHGFGNDYIVVEKADMSAAPSIAEFAKAVCQRNTGAGSDGIAVLEKLDADAADYFCEIINPDGSLAGFSGNGTRCAVAYLYHNNMWSAPTLRLQTKSGVKKFRLVNSTPEGHYVFEAEIGKPRFASDVIPFATIADSTDVLDRKLSVNGEPYCVSCVNVGNPVACIFVEDFDFDWRSVGQSLEVHEAFPQKANIVFVKVIDRSQIELRIWERAAGETSASGTCASGAAILSSYTGRTNREVSVRTVGGITTVVWRDDDEIVITGNADFVYRGEWPIAA